MYLVTFLSIGHLHGVMPGDRVSLMRGLSLLGVVNHSAATQPALVRELKRCVQSRAQVCMVRMPKCRNLRKCQRNKPMSFSPLFARNSFRAAASEGAAKVEIRVVPALTKCI